MKEYMKEYNIEEKKENSTKDLSTMSNTKENIMKLFDQQDKDRLKPIFDIDFDSIYTGHSEYQIKHFILNRKEFTNDLHVFNQAKFELWSRISIFFDSYCQYHKALAEIDIAEDDIDQLKKDNNMSEKKRSAKIRLQEIEIEKNKLALFHVKKQAQKVLTECCYFYDAYNQLRYLETITPEERSKLEEEGWKIKSAYFPEITQRYGLTPAGFLSLPHQEGGLDTLLKNIKEQKKLTGFMFDIKNSEVEKLMENINNNYNKMLHKDLIQEG